MKKIKTYDVKFFVKKEFGKDEFIDLVLLWINDSKHYHSETLATNSSQIISDVTTDSYCFSANNIKLTIKSRTDSLKNTITACLFEYLDSNAVWTVSLILFQTRKQQPYLILQQHIKFDETKNIDISLNRPYIVKLLYDYGCIASKEYLLFSNWNYGDCLEKHYYYTAAPKDVKLITDIILGKGKLSIPMIYFSLNTENMRYGATFKDIRKLAIDLIGSAYVVLEMRDINSIDKISLHSKCRKPFRGYIGIYFPGQSDCFLINPNAHCYNLSSYIKSLIWKHGAYNRSDCDITWEKFLGLIEWNELIQIQKDENYEEWKKGIQLKERLTFLEEHQNATALRCPPKDTLSNLNTNEKEIYHLVIEALKNGLDRYTEHDGRGYRLLTAILSTNLQVKFDSNAEAHYEVSKLNFDNSEREAEKVASKLSNKHNQLIRDNHILTARLCQFENKDINLIEVPDNINEFFDNEINDLLLLCIEDEIDKCSDASKSHEKLILQAILDSNNKGSTGKLKMSRIAQIISRISNWTPKIERELESEGFVFQEERKHHKGYFIDSSYPVTFSCTPSDYRTAQNTRSDIMKKISIY